MSKKGKRKTYTRKELEGMSVRQICKLIPGGSLAEGGHADPEEEDTYEKAACVMEAVAWIAGDDWSDHPQCADPVLTEFAISYNDIVTNEDRQELVRAIPALVGSRSGDGRVRYRRIKKLVEELAARTVESDDLISAAVRSQFLATKVEARSLERLQKYAEYLNECGDAGWDTISKIIADMQEYPAQDGRITEDDYQIRFDISASEIEQIEDFPDLLIAVASVR